MTTTILFSDFITEHFSYDSATGLITNTKTGKVYSKNRNDGYILIRVVNKHTGEATMVRAHRLAWYLYYGVEPSVIDHKNGIRDDNRIANLQNTTQAANTQNNKPRSSYPCAYKHGTNYMSRVRQDNKDVCLGQYSTQYDAHLVATYYRAKNFTNYHGNDLSKVPLPAGTVKHPYFSNTLFEEIKKIETTSGVKAIDYFIKVGQHKTNSTITK